jgi:hypothetical protein
VAIAARLPTLMKIEKLIKILLNGEWFPTSDEYELHIMD